MIQSEPGSFGVSDARLCVLSRRFYVRKLETLCGEHSCVVFTLRQLSIQRAHTKCFNWKSVHNKRIQAHY